MPQAFTNAQLVTTCVYARVIRNVVACLSSSYNQITLHTTLLTQMNYCTTKFLKIEMFGRMYFLHLGVKGLN